MKVVERHLDIDRWMSRLQCACGAEWWHCERRPVRCPGCGAALAAEEIQKMGAEFSAKGG